MKCWPEHFAKLLSGEKGFELRLNDRDYKTGDVLYQREWSRSRGYTGREIRRRVSYVLDGGDFGLAQGHVAMSLAPLAPTPEYLAGWLACQKAAADDAAEAHHELMAPSRLSSEFFAWRIRALAPPSAPPVSAPPDMVENTAPAAYCHGCGRALGKEEVHCDDCADELREGETSQNGTAVSDDRLLLLKALVARKAVMHTDCRPDIVAIEGGGVGLVCRIDPEGFPILTDSLRAALTEATHG